MPSIRMLVVAMALGTAAGTLAAFWLTLDEANGHVLPVPAAPSGARSGPTSADARDELVLAGPRAAGAWRP